MEEYLLQMIHSGSRNEQENPTILVENVQPKTGTTTLKGPSTAGTILLNFELKTRKSILNKVTKFQLPTRNHLGGRIEKPPGGTSCPRKE